jgi:hypothetical protein
MIDPSIEQLGGRVLAEAEDVAAPDPRHAPAARDDEEGSVRMLRSDHVVGEDAELRPGAVGFPDLGSSPPPQRCLPSGPSRPLRHRSDIDTLPKIITH